MSDRPGEMDERDVEERFASIVAAWEVPAPSARTADEVDTGEEADGSADAGERDTDEPDPGDTDGAREADDADGPDGPEDAGRTGTQRPPWVNPSPLDVVLPASTWRVATPSAGGGAAGDRDGRGDGDEAGAPADDEHFEPPPVSLPPQEDLHFWGAVVGLVGGPLLLLYVALARPFHSDRWFAAGVVLSLVGFGLLVLRQPRYRDPSDDDDGARV